MTWLPVEKDERAERDAVLGLVPEPYAALRAVLAAAWEATDPSVLELCRIRLAQLAGASAELDGVADADLDAVEHWAANPSLGSHERAALAFAEQYHYDHRLAAGSLLPSLAEHLTKRQLVNFVWALHMNDSYLRLLSLYDIAADPPGGPARPECTPPPGDWAPPAADDAADEAASVKTLMQPLFEDAYRTLNPVVVRQSRIDDVTSEAIRLRNASFQGCFY